MENSLYFKINGYSLNFKNQFINIQNNQNNQKKWKIGYISK